jgi:hypothetical protein
MYLFEDALPIALKSDLAFELAIEKRLDTDHEGDTPDLHLHREANRVEFGGRSPSQDLSRAIKWHAKQMLDLLCRR